MDTGGREELAYEPGDHLAVFPENRKELITSLIGLLDNAPPCDQPIKIEMSREVSGKNYFCAKEVCSPKRTN